LRNASKVMRVCNDVGIDIVFNGHRHHGYMVQLPAHPTIISSPSSTMGCKSSDMRYVWHVDLAGVYPHPQVYRFTDERALTAEGEDLPSEEELEEANDAEVAEPEEAVSS